MIKKSGWFFAVCIFALTFNIGGASAETYVIDSVHSTIGFVVKHLQVGKTRGGFSDYSGTISYEPEEGFLQTDITIQAASINTQNEGRDKHLRSPDFLDVSTYPTISFKSRQFSPSGDGRGIIMGDLTIHGITKTIDFPVTVTGPVTSPFGSQVIGLSGVTVINRKDYEITWNKLMDNGGLVVGDNVSLVIEVEAQKK